jgi:lipopolysaccharide export system permease protein
LFKTFDRYVLREVWQSWVAVTGVLLVILVSNQVARVISQAASNGFPRDAVLTLVGLSSLQNLTVLVPVGMLLAIVLALGRLYHESEMSAARACGIGPRQLYRPIVALALPLALALAWLTLDVAPRATARVQQLRAEALRDAEFGALEAGKFRTFGGRGVFYAGRVDADGTLADVFVQRQLEDRLEVTIARRARHATSADGGLQVITLQDGERYEGAPGARDFRLVRFAEYSIPVRVPDPATGKQRRRERPTGELLASALPGDRAELQWRLSLPLMVLVLTLLAVPLAALAPRQGRYGRVGYAILIYFVYTNLLSATQVWIEQERIDAGLGVWWVHALVVGLALWLLHRQSPLIGRGRA